MFLEDLKLPMAESKAELHIEKTNLVCCKEPNHKGEFDQTRFDFLGFTIIPRDTHNKSNQELNIFHLHTGQTTEELVQYYDPAISG